MKRIARGPVRGISLRLQEEERERRMDIIPEKSALDVDTIDVDAETKDMIRALMINVGNVNLVVQDPKNYKQRRGASDRPARSAPAAERS